MQAVIFYFSGTGNTWWCSDRMVEHLKRHGIESQMISIEQTDPDECARSICDADLVGIGYPIYGSDLPDIVKHFIDDILPTAPPQKPRLFLYCTQLMFSGDGAYVYADTLRARGWEIYSAVHLLMPNNISMSIMPLLFRNDPVHIGRRLARTDMRIRHMIDRMIAGRPLKQGHSRLSTLLALMQRAPFRTYFPVLRDDISVDDELCTRCAGVWRSVRSVIWDSPPKVYGPQGSASSVSDAITSVRSLRYATGAGPLTCEEGSPTEVLFPGSDPNS